MIRLPKINGVLILLAVLALSVTLAACSSPSGALEQRGQPLDGEIGSPAATKPPDSLGVTPNPSPVPTQAEPADEADPTSSPTTEPAETTAPTATPAPLPTPTFPEPEPESKAREDLGQAIPGATPIPASPPGVTATTAVREEAASSTEPTRAALALSKAGQTRAAAAAPADHRSYPSATPTPLPALAYVRPSPHGTPAAVRVILLVQTTPTALRPYLLPELRCELLRVHAVRPPLHLRHGRGHRVLLGDEAVPARRLPAPA